MAINSISLRRRVRKLRASAGGDRPWFVSNHPLGSKFFATWREAYTYANYQSWKISFDRTEMMFEAVGDE
jgi:hypothetical protein